MAWSYSRISAAIKAAADIGTALQKFVLGTPHYKVMFPNMDDLDLREMSYSHDTGQMWLGDTIPLILEHIAGEIDSAGIVWAYIDTMGTGVTPVIRAGKGVQSVSKNTVGLDSVTITLEMFFSTAYWCPIVNLFNRTAIIKYAAMNYNAVLLNFLSHDGVTDLGADNQSVFFVGIGQH